MADKSTSTAGAHDIVHEYGDTFVRTITIAEGGVPVDLTGATIQWIVSTTKDGETLQEMDFIESDLEAGEVKVQWQTAGLLTLNKTYFHKLTVTFPNGVIKSYLEGKFKAE